VSQSGPLIRLAGVAKSFGGHQAVRDVTLEIGRGEFFSVLGPSGCGKTTLLRLIGGFERPDQGRVFIDGVDMTDAPPFARPVNTVFQSYAVFPHMTVAGNVAFGLKQERLSKAEIRERVAQMLDLVELRSLADRKPHQLSGGQRQRVALARSLAKLPKALLLDEPMAALDRKLREQTQAELAAIQRRLGITFIHVTHDQDEALAMSHRMAVMRDGRFEQTGGPREIYEAPCSRFVAEFVGRINLFEGKVVGGDRQWLVVDTGDGNASLRVTHDRALAAGTPVWVAVRPERIVGTATEHGGAASNRGTGVVRALAYFGDTTLCTLELPTGKALRLAGAGPAPQIGEAIGFAWRPEHGVVLTR
jgi:putrescine transport system ATP-binding protein